MVWANFLHIYQPPTQKQFWIDKVTRESYLPLFSGLSKIPQAKVVLNINAVLAELLVKFGHQDVINAIRTLAENGQLEFTGSAKFHPLLPKIPKDEVIRQVHLNEETNKQIFGEVYKPKGFFPPEMAFSVEVAGIVRELGYEWLICDELSFPREETGIDYSKIYTVNGLGDFAIYFRERATSNKILSFQLADASLIVQDLHSRLAKHEYLLTAMDGETFGHHRLGLEQVLFDIYKSNKLESVLISSLPSLFQGHTAVDPLPSTWALMEKDLEQNVPFARWDDKDNEIHHMQWELLYLAVDSVKAEGDNLKARELLDRAMHSDQFWWAGAKPWWSIEYIEAGAKELKDTVQVCHAVAADVKRHAQALYYNILTTAFDWQRSGKVEALSKAEDEEIRQRVDRALPNIKDEEFASMIDSLIKQKNEAVKREEYERAAQFRDRIAELQEQREKYRIP